MSDFKHFRIDGADGEGIEVPAGEFYFNTKDRCRRMMLNSLSAEARQVYACLEYHTMAFQQELAVKMVGGKRVPLAPSDVANETGLSKQHVRRAMVELEDEGLAKREGDAEKGLRNGHVRLYSWASPHPTANIKKVATRGYLPDWFPDEIPGLASLAKQKKYEIPDTVAARDYLLVHAPEAERAYQKGLKVAVEVLDSVCALAETGPHIERTERTPERTGNSSSSPSQPAAADDDVPSPDPIAPIMAAFAGWNGFTDAKARRLLKDCGGATPQEVADKARQEFATIAGNKAVRNPVGLVITNLQEFFHSPDALKQWRRERDIAADEAAAEEQNTAERLREFERQDAEREERERLIDDRWNAMDPEERKALVKAELQRVRKEHPVWPTETVQDVAERQVRARIAEEKAEGAS